MRINGFEWDDNNIQHIALHQVVPEEAEEIFISRHIVRKTRDERYMALGRTTEGRYLAVVFIRKRDKIRVITARDMDRKERGLFKRKE